MEKYLQVGVVASTHGLRGEVKVFPTTDDVKRFKRLKHVLLGTKKETKIETKLLEIEGVKFFKQFAILKFKGIDDINEAQRYKGCPLYVERKDAVPLDEGEYYVADLIGMRVVTDDGEEFGIIEDVMETGANDVYVVGRPDHAQVLIPAIKECIREIDTGDRRMTIHLMDGLV